MNQDKQINRRKSSQPKPKTQPPKKKTAQQKRSNNRRSLLYSTSAAEYLKTVLAPCSGNARIPDLNCIPTALITLTNEVSFVTSALGVGGMYFQLGAVLAYTSETVATTTDAAITYDAVTQIAGYTQLTTDTEAFRIVSACIDVSYTGTDLANSGIITGWTITRAGSYMDPVPVSATAARSSRSNTTNRFDQGMTAYYRPGNSDTAFSFRTPAAGFNLGFLGVHISGAAASAPFFVTMTVNVEAVPVFDTYSPMNSLATSSPIDLVGHAKAVELVSKAPVFTTQANGRKFNTTIASAPNTLESVWNTAKTAYGGAVTAAKIGRAAAKLFL